MDDHDQYESLGLDDSLEDERDLDQIMEDRRAAEMELETRDAQFTRRKLPELLHDHGNLASSVLPESRILTLFLDFSLFTCALSSECITEIRVFPFFSHALSLCFL